MPILRIESSTKIWIFFSVLSAQLQSGRLLLPNLISRDSVVSIATCYWLGDPAFEPRWGY
jgi:hypothetical protein